MEAQKLQEDIDTFDTWVSSARAKKASDSYSAMSGTQEGQLQILNDAAEGNTVAADFLFDLFKKIISKAFWKYYLGPDKKYHAPKIRAGGDKDFASMAYEMLLGSGETSPYDTFKPTKFTSAADLLKQFGYYLYRYLQNEAFKLIRAEKMGGMTGNVKQDGEAVSVAGYEDHFENSEDASAADSFTGEVEMQETIRTFLIYLKKTKKIYYDVFLAKLKGASIEEVAVKLSISGQSVRNHLKAIKAIYDEFTGGNL